MHASELVNPHAAESTEKLLKANVHSHCQRPKGLKQHLMCTSHKHKIEEILYKEQNGLILTYHIQMTL